MFRLSSLRWQPKTLQQMFRKLKLAGAHPDILWGIDAQKAQHNGEEMIRLETLMHQRESGTLKNNVSEEFLLWLKPSSQRVQGGHGTQSAAPASSAMLKAVSCTITPLARPQIVKDQLTRFFQDAEIYEEFELGQGGIEMDLEGVLRHADQQQNLHLHQAGSLYIRGDQAVENLRRFGVLLVVEEDGISYLVTLPETQPLSPGGGQSSTSYSTPQLPMRGPSRGIIGPNGEIDPDVQAFMDERGLRPFDLRMAGSHSSVERFVTAFERLERMYDVHRGRALRPSVCLVLSLKSPDNFIAPDGSLVLTVQRMASWEEYLLGLPQSVWQDCVRKHQEWRLGYAPKLQERKRQLARVGDMFHFFRVVMEAPIGGRLMWQDDLISRFHTEEKMIRRTLEKYHLKSDLLKKRGEMCVVEHLYSVLPQGDGTRKEIGFRVSGDGRLYINYSSMNTGQILRVLKDNLKRLETFKRQHDNVTSSLEHLSRSIPVDFSVDTNWKHREEANLVHCLEKFVATIKQNESELGAFMRGLTQGGGGGSGTSGGSTQGAVVPGNLPVKKRMVWIISDRFDVMPSGVVFIPYDVDFDSIKKMLLTHS